MNYTKTEYSRDSWSMPDIGVISMIFGSERKSWYVLTDPELAFARGITDVINASHWTPPRTDTSHDRGDSGDCARTQSHELRDEVYQEKHQLA